MYLQFIFILRTRGIIAVWLKKKKKKSQAKKHWLCIFSVHLLVMSITNALSPMPKIICD